MRQSASFLMIALAASLATGCTQQSARPTVGSTDLEPRVTDIQYRAGPCHGTCPVYSVDIGADGSTRFTGEQFTTVEGERVRTNDPERFALVRERLSSWQPAMGTTLDTPDCGPKVTDLSHYVVTWTTDDGEEATLKHDSGCRSESARQLTEVLRSVPQALGIEAWIGH
ncbi:hypothetical protein F0A16_10955 [Salinicola corii]|uniref:DUF6438 domain-containing protein n=1 Tax=Salinicola corii TaxID=2606937 RepID=A0A640WE25_9GAMM|nr:DUF6438 domain-containing protein [Salinicola corii]KAA0018231.1 hypothetical protein F0A16_10955 [Salinicola corii]